MHALIVNRSSSMNHTLFQLYALPLTCESYMFPFLTMWSVPACLSLQANIFPTPPFYNPFKILFNHISHPSSPFATSPPTYRNQSSSSPTSH